MLVVYKCAIDTIQFDQLSEIFFILKVFHLKNTSPLRSVRKVTPSLSRPEDLPLLVVLFDH